MTTADNSIATVSLSVTEVFLLRDALDSHMTRLATDWERATDRGGRAEAAALSRRMQQLEALDVNLATATRR